MLQVHWLVPIVLYIVLAYIGIRWMQKKIVDLHSKTKRLFLNFLFCALFAITFAVVMGHVIFNTMTLIIFGIGILNGVANYASWKATSISLSRTSLFSFVDDIIPMALSYAILGEGQFLNTFSEWGIALCFLATILFVRHSYKKEGRASLVFFVYVAVYSIIWGIANFSARYSAVSGVPVGQFLMSWYIGSFVTATLLVLLYKDPDEKPGRMPALAARDVLVMFVYAGGIALCLAIEFWALTLAPQTLVQPIFLVAEATIPTVIGLTIFKERSTFDRAQWCFAALGMLGVILIAFSY